MTVHSSPEPEEHADEQRLDQEATKALPLPHGLSLRRIVAPVDFSAAAAGALRYAARVARSTGAHLCVLHVAPRESDAGSEATRHALGEFVAEAGVLEPDLELLVCWGLLPGGTIVDVAHQTRTDLIVLPTCSRAVGLLPPFIGGTTRIVLRSFQRMVLTLGQVSGTFAGLLPLHDALAPWDSGSGRDLGGAGDHVPEPVYPPRHLTFVMLGNAASRRAFELLRPLVLVVRPRLTLVAVPPHGEEDDTTASLDDIRRHLNAYAGVELDVETRLADRRSVAQALLQWPTDLIVVGRNDEGDAPPNLLASTVRRIVRHSYVPVLSIVSTRLDDIDHRFRRITRTLTREELAMSSAGGSETDQILQELAGASAGTDASELLLGLYGDRGLFQVAERVGIVQTLQARGFRQLLVRLGRRDGRDMCQLYCNGEVHPDNLLLEVVLQVQVVVPLPWMENVVGSEPFRVLSLEWVLLQDPRGDFTLERPPLPGQRKPGLGVGFEVAELFVLAAERLGCDGLWNYPQFYHNARLYREKFRFVSPATEGLVLALERAGSGHSLADMGWAIELDLVTEQNSGTVFHWQSCPQMLALSPRARVPFMSGEYRRETRKALAAHHFVVDWERLPPPATWPELAIRQI